MNWKQAFGKAFHCDLKACSQINLKAPPCTNQGCYLHTMKGGE